MALSEERIRRWNERGVPFFWFLGLSIVAALIGAPFGVPALLRVVYRLQLDWSVYAIISFVVAVLAFVAFLFATVNLWLRSAGFDEVLDVTPPVDFIRSRRRAVLRLGLGLLGLSVGINIGKTIFT